LSSGSIIFPGAIECIQTLARSFPLAIASGALGPEIAQVLGHAGLAGCFKAISSASDGVRGKPAPDLYLLALAKLRGISDVSAAGCVAIEDSLWGLEAAKLAGMRTVAITHTYPAADLGTADLVVNQLDEITVQKLQALVS
jgi:beta-phosphoglucomutase-like phosphatase (HAD superfamily)